MTLIDIPFSDLMEDANRQLKKTCTSRGKRYGNPGDTFHSGGYVFKLIDVICFPLGFIRDQFYLLEGFDSSEAFEEAWCEYHQGKFDPNDHRWSHFYLPIGKDELATVEMEVKIDLMPYGATNIEYFELWLNDIHVERTVSLKEMYLMTEVIRDVDEVLNYQLVDKTDVKLLRRIFGEK